MCTNALNPIKFVCTCIYRLQQKNKFYQIGMHLIYFLNLKYFQTLKWCTCCYLFIYHDCNVLQFKIDIFDLDTTTVHAGCSKLLPLKNHIARCLLVYKQKKDVHGRAYTNALHLYTSDIEITLNVIIRILYCSFNIVSHYIRVILSLTIAQAK